jgi:hypothetical protein
LGDAQGALSLRFTRSADADATRDDVLDLDVTVIGPVAWQATFAAWVTVSGLEGLACWLETDSGLASTTEGLASRVLLLERSATGGETRLVLRPVREHGVHVTHGELQDAPFVFLPGEIRIACDWLRSQVIQAGRA